MTASLLVPAADKNQSEARPAGYERLHEMAVLLRDAVRRETGGTVDPRTCRYADLRHGYMVSLRRFGRRFTHSPSVREVYEWLTEIAVEAVEGEEDRYLGVWRDPSSGDCSCDMTVVIDTHAQSIRRGVEERQLCIYDNARRQLHALPLADAAIALTTTGGIAS